MATFGETTPLAATDEKLTVFDFSYAFPYTASQGGTLTKLSIYGGTVSGSGTMQMALYNVSGKVVGSRVAISSAVSVGTTIQWYDFAMTGTIISGNVYAIAVGNLSIDVQWNSYSEVDTGDLRYMTGDLPDPFVEEGGWARKHSVYATYTPTSTPHFLGLLGVGT